MPKANKPTATENSASSIASAYETLLPDLLNAANAQIGPTAESQLAASRAVSPGYAELLSNLYRNYGPELASALASTEGASRASNARTDLGILSDVGPSLAAAGRNIDTILNPEVAAVRGQAAGKLGELLSSINLNTPMVEAERLIGQEESRTGNANVRSATGTVSNALSFGRELADRQQRLGQAISQATAFLPSASNQFNPAATALNRTTNVAGIFPGIAGAPTQPYNFGEGVLSAVSGVQQQRNQQAFEAPSGYDRFAQVFGNL